MTSADSSRASTSFHLRYIQGLRALAVILVIAYHSSAPLSGAFIGVDVFFVISGFVICRLLMHELETTGGLRFDNFYLRRARRLLPALALVLLATAAISALVQSPIGGQQDTARAGLGSSVWLSNAVLYLITGGYFDNSADSIPLLHTWSLSVEEQFYLVFPALIFGAWKLGANGRLDPRKVVFSVLTVVSIASFGLSLYLSFGNALPHVSKPGAAAFYSMPTRAWEFGVGALVAIALMHRTSATRHSSAIATLGVLAVATGSLFISGTHEFPGWVAMAPALGTVALILGCNLSGGIVSRTLASRPLVWVGDVSYGWYLWHFPFIVFAHALWPELGWVPFAAALLSLVAAHVSFKYVESPIRARRPPLRRSLVLIGACVVLPAIAFSSLLSISDKGWYRHDIRAAQAQLDPVPIGYERGCHSLRPLGDRNLGPCTFGDSGPKVWLLGDSNAGQFADGLVQLADQGKIDLTLATASGCPVVDVQVVTNGVEQPGCSNYVSKSLSWLAEQKPATVILAAANEAVTDTKVVLRDNTTIASSVDAKGALWAAGLVRVIHTLEAAGHRVVVMRTIPHLKDSSGSWWTPSTCLMTTVWSNPAACGPTVSLREETARQLPSLRAEAAAIDTTGVATIDLRSEICPAGECDAFRDGRWIFRDGLHISTGESRELGDDLLAPLKAARR